MHNHLFIGKEFFIISCPWWIYALNSICFTAKKYSCITQACKCKTVAEKLYKLCCEPLYVSKY